MSPKDTVLEIANRCDVGTTTKWDGDYLRSVAELVGKAESLCALQMSLEIEADTKYIDEMEAASGENEEI